MKNDLGLFSKDELAILKNFANNAAKEDKRIHGIRENNGNINNNNKQKQLVQKK